MQSFDAVSAGLTHECTRIVEENHVVSHTGTPVLSTPMMISMVERACMDLVQPLLPAGYTTVGYEVHIKHKAPAQLGAALCVFCRLLEVEGRRLLFATRVSEAGRLIGEGTHRRTIIPIPD